MNLFAVKIGNYLFELQINNLLNFIDVWLKNSSFFSWL